MGCGPVSFLLDTNILSELRSKTPDPGLLGWWSEVEDHHLFLSVLTIGEIEQGVARLRHRGDQVQAESLARWLGRIIDSFGDRIVPIGVAEVREWALMNVPDRMPVVDGLLAATARHRQWTLVTRNTKDVENRGVRLLDPFEG